MEFITKNEYSYKQIKEGILNGTFKPGEKLVVNTLSKKFGISSMPVREALLRLEQEGLLESTPHVGARVHKCDYNQFYELIQITIVLESLASQLAARFITDDTLNDLEKLKSEMENTVENQDVQTYLKLNKDFHMTIYRSSGNKELYNLIVNHHSLTYPYTSIALSTPGRLTKSIDEHNEWLSALKEHNVDKCGLMSKQQRLESYHLFLDYLVECLENPDKPDSKFYLYTFSDVFVNKTLGKIRKLIEQYRMIEVK